MKKMFKIGSFFCVAMFSASLMAQDSPYAQTVKALGATYYYQLNETDTSNGVVDSMGNGPTGTYNGDYDGGAPEVGAPGPDFLFEGGAWTVSAEWDDFGDELDIVGLGPDNVAHASNNEGHITLGDGSLFATNAMTVSMFALGGPANGGDRLFTNNVSDPTTSFQIVVGNDGIVVSTNPTVECDFGACGHKSLFLPGEGVEYTNQGADRGLNDTNNGWWHIVASTFGETAEERSENIQLWLNGVDRTADMLPGTTGWGTDTGLAKIGGRRADPFDSTTHSGAQDEVAIWLDRVLTGDEAVLLYDVAVGRADPPEPSNPGDYNNDGAINAADIDLMTVQMNAASPDLNFDENNDGSVDLADRTIWVENLRKTYFGDSNLDGEFNSSDFVAVFTAGEYEDTAVGNSTWAEGDWNGDGDFNSSDFVTAFSAGGYEIGPRGGVAAVPEPASQVMILLGLLGLSLVRRRK
ncbi:MAG: PEP-CTERM sorting domain-containing protein [Planctomycetales bacterium]|nr:PEP-CTERM sorting domain-containing protein [Planctomycetales bacterium]